MGIRALLIVLPLIGSSLLSGCRPPANQKLFPSQDERLLNGFQHGSAPTAASYDRLFIYFLEGFITFSRPTGSMAAYPGLPSRHGKIADGLEGFARSAPLWGAWVASGRPRVVTLPNGQSVDLELQFRQGILSGTDPQSEGYWGNIPYFDNQRIVEASDIALSIWLFRNSAWTQFTPAQKEQVASWLYQVNGKHTPDNNWHVFITFTNVVLGKLGCRWNRAEAETNYQRLKQFYRGDGWFSDGPDDTFDYYNAWGIHYQLYWLDQVAPEWDHTFISDTRQQFVTTYEYLVGLTGVPILGRSVCYRMAAVAPLIFGSGNNSGEIDPHVARRALDLTWTHFIQNGAVRRGNVTQGYCAADPRVLDNYSGPASCLWALRSLIVAYYLPSNSQFWLGVAGKLPVEIKDSSFIIPSTGWQITGHQASGTVEIDTHQGRANVKLQSYNWLRKLATALLWRPFRPDNVAAKYHRSHYFSDPPFCGCLK